MNFSETKMRPLKELNRIINNYVTFMKIPIVAEHYFKRFNTLTELKTQEDRNNVLQFLCHTGSSWDDSDAKQVKQELMNHVKKSIGQPVHEPYVIK